MPPADTRRASRRASRQSACTFYLVFKEPAGRAIAPMILTPRPPSSPSALFPSGEPFNPTDPTPLCQASRAFRRFLYRVSLLRLSILHSPTPHRLPMSLPRVEMRQGSCELKECRPTFALLRFIATPGHARFIQYRRRPSPCQLRGATSDAVECIVFDRLAFSRPFTHLRAVAQSDCAS
jgi:hypothetical protein